MKTTSLKTSQLIKEAGVECESYFVYIMDGILGTVILPRNIQVDDYDYYAYTLQDLPEVLKELGRIKGWNLRCVNCNQIPSIKDSECCGDGFASEWFLRWIEVCKLYATQGMEAVDEYLINLLK
jgi:hypothetical protein